MIEGLKPYPSMKDSGVPWLGEVPVHWKPERAKWLFRKMNRPVKDSDDVVTCFRDGIATLRKNRRVRGFTESLKEIGYQGVRRGDLVIHAMDAFAGAVGVSDSVARERQFTRYVSHHHWLMLIIMLTQSARWRAASGSKL